METSWLRVLLVVALLCLPLRCFRAQESRQSTPDPNVHKASAVHVQSSLVVVPLTAVDRAGNLVEDLSQPDFRVWDDGVQQRIAHVELTVQPVSAVIVVQANEAMAPLLDQVRPLGSLLSNLLLGPQGEAAVVTYADRARVIQPLSNDPNAVAKSLQKISAGGRAARLNDALVRSISMLDAEPKARRRIIIAFSEGFDRGSETNAEQVIRAASDANVTIYGLRFSPNEETLKSDKASGMFEHLLVPCPHGPPSVQCRFQLNAVPLGVVGLQMASKQLRTDLLRQYAAYTGGLVYSHWKKGSLQSQLQTIATDINS